MLTDLTSLEASYRLMERAGSAGDRQLEGLQQEEIRLKAMLNDIRKSSAAYDREFQDRLEAPRATGFFERIGMKTIQDWVLFLFYISLACVFLLFVLYYAARGALFGKKILVLILGAIVVGFGTTAFLTRYA